MWVCEDAKMSRCEDEKMWRWTDVKMRRCEDEKVWRWADVKMSRCEDEKVWRWADVKMSRCEDEQMWRWEGVREGVKMRRWDTDPHHWKNPALRRSREKQLSTLFQSKIWGVLYPQYINIYTAGLKVRMPFWWRQVDLEIHFRVPREKFGRHSNPIYLVLKPLNKSGTAF